LAIVKPGLASKEILEQTTSFAFRDGTVVTYNDEISISHPIKEINFEGAIKAEELYGLLIRLKKEDVELEIAEESLRIQCGRVKAELRLEQEIILPKRKLKKKWGKIKNPEQFKSFMNLAMQTCSSDMSQPKLTCVYVTSDGGIVGADGFRVVHCQGHGSPVEDYLIPATGVREMLKINPIEVQLEKSWIHFRNEQGTILSSRRLNDSYVDQTQFDKAMKVKKKEKITFPDTIEEMLDRGKVFAKRGFDFDEVIEIEISNKKIVMRAIADDTKSSIEEDASIKCKSQISFMITPSLFEDILKMTRTCILDKGGTKLKFTMEDKEGGVCEYLIMLVAK